MRISLRSTVPLLALCSFVFSTPSGHAQSGSELHFCLHGEPKTFNPILVDDEASENVRYLTGGVLIRVNRQTQALEPALAESWQVSRDGRKITFHLRKGLYFSDGSPFSSEDVAYTMKLLMDPQTHSATGDAFRTGDGTIDVQTPTPDVAVISFPTLVAGLERLFDQVAILSAQSPKKEMSVLGPYYVSEYVAGSHVLLRRNPNYWKHDSEGHPLPYIETVRLDIQRNRDIELMRFRRGELQLINRLDAEQFDRLQKDSPGVARNAGIGLDGEELWFNQTATSNLPDYKKKSKRRRSVRPSRCPSTAPISRESFSTATPHQPTAPSRRRIISGSTLLFQLPNTIPKLRFFFSRMRDTAWKMAC